MLRACKAKVPGILADVHVCAVDQCQIIADIYIAIDTQRTVRGIAQSDTIQCAPITMKHCAIAADDCATSDDATPTGQATCTKPGAADVQGTACCAVAVVQHTSDIDG